MFKELYCAEDIYKNVEYVKSLYENQQEKVKKEQYIESVLLDDYVKVIKHIPNKYDYIEEFFVKAQQEIGNKKKSERKNYQIVEDWLSGDFFNGDKMKIKSIVSGGYENYYWAFYFDFCGQEISIEIHMRNRITTDNIHYAHYGKFVVFLKENSVCQTAIFQSYKMEEVAKFLSQWKKEKENANETD